MLNSNIIKTLNSKNISSNPDITKQRLNTLWKNCNKQQKEKAVQLGGYTDTRSFNKSRTSGLISVRMTVTLAQTLDIDPFYIIADVDSKSNCSMDKIKNFLNQFGYGQVLEEENNGPLKQEILCFVNKLLDGIDNDSIEAIESLSNEELETLLKSYLISARITDERIRLFLIKLLLIKR